MDKELIVDPKKEFLVVRHRCLNVNSYYIEECVYQMLKLGKHTNGRAVVPCLEGDIIQVEQTGEIVLTHQSFIPLSQGKYRNLRELLLAAPLEEVLNKVAEYRQDNPNQRVVLCFEPKAITSDETISRVISELNRYGIKDAYFDSFFGGKLDMVAAANRIHGTAYARSLHAIGNVANAKMLMTLPREGYDILTVPKVLSFGKLDEPVIYGAVSSAGKLEIAAGNPLVHGAYARFNENSQEMLWNSLTNRKRLRRII